MDVQTIKSLADLVSRKEEGTLTGAFYISDEAYFNSGIIGSSGLKQYYKSPAHYEASLSQDSDNPAFRLGRAIHKVVLEGPEAFNASYIVQPKFDRRTKAGKTDYEDWRHFHKNKEILTPAEGETIDSIVYWLGIQNGTSILNDCETEIAVFAQQDDVWFRGRLDKYNPLLNYIVDLKTTSADSIGLFKRHCFQYGYHIQAAYYARLCEVVLGVDTPAYYILGLPKTPPHELMVVRLEDSAMDLGLKIVNDCMSKHIECTKKGEWPFYETTISRLEAPEWAVNEYETKGES